MTQVLSEVFVYAIVSALALGVDFAILYLLVEAAGLHYLLAATCSFTAGAVVAYFLSARLVFRYRRLANDRRLEFLIFTGIGVIGLAINGVAMFILVEVLGLQYLMAKAAASLVTFSANFVARRWALFSQKRGAEDKKRRVCGDVL
jgi:putative flippase GtrA